ncbi:hypothetical protein ACHAXM_000796 [Skeletonema potamos]
MKTTLLLAAMPAAAVAFSVRPGAEQSIKATDSPLFQPVYYSRPTHSSRRRSRLMLWRRNKSNSQYKLQAYTVAPEDARSNPWLNFLNFRDSVADYADSLFSLEGGEATSKAATRPYMPNLDVEERLSVSSTAVAATTTTELSQDELLMELNSLSETFDDLQSYYEATIDSLKDENSFLEEGLKMLTLTIEEQAEQIEQLQKRNTLGEILEAEESDLDGIGKIFENKASAEAVELVQVQKKVTTLESDNEMLRQRVRSLEVALSDVAFESRKVVAAAAAVEAPADVVAMEVAEVAATAVAADVVVEQVNVVTRSPHAPSTPIPKHLLQQQEIEMLRVQIQEYEVERKSVRKLFGRGIRRGMKKVGKALDLWRPIFLILCDGVRGDGKMAL